MEATRFDVIGRSYEAALAKYPNCRTDHVWLMRHAALEKCESLLEVSGGTGFLTEKIAAKLPAKAKMFVQDVAPAVLEINANKNNKFQNINYMIEHDMNFPKLKGMKFDSIINLGGFHHIEDQVTFAKTAFQLLRPGGVMCLGDFEDNSSMQRYFDDRIHYITATGHQGLFASASRFVNLGRFAGFEKVKVERIRVPFSFRSKQEIGDFFKLVHDLDQDPAETYQDIEKYFEIIEWHEVLMVMIDYVYVCYTK